MGDGLPERRDECQRLGYLACLFVLGFLFFFFYRRWQSPG